MNKYTLSITLISSLALSNCAKIKEYRKDPSERGKDKRLSTTVENSPFKTKLRNGSVIQKQAQPDFIAPSAPIAPSVQPISDVSPIQIQPITQASPANITPARVTQDFIEPDITGLPNNVDLLESNNVAPILKPLPATIPAPKPEPIIRDVDPVVPSLAPLLNDPNDGLIPPP